MLLQLALAVPAAAAALLFKLAFNLWRKRSAASAAQRLIEDGDKASAVERGALKAPCLPVKPPAQACAPANRGADKGRAAVSAMLEAFNLNPAATSAMLSGARYGGWRGVLAGGAMLHCYMGLPPSEHKGDLDAFIAAEEVAAWEHLLKGAGYRISRVIRTAGEGGSTGYVPAGEQEEGEEAAEVSTVEQSGGGGDQADGEAYLALGTQAGSGSKDPAEEAEEQDLEDYSALGKSYAKVGAGKGYAYIDRGISQVRDYTHHSTGRVVQLVVCKEPENMPLSFDLSAAATWWDGRQLKTLHPKHTDRCEAFFMTEGTSNEANRAKKYRAKGFTIVKRPWWC